MPLDPNEAPYGFVAVEIPPSKMMPGYCLDVCEFGHKPPGESCPELARDANLTLLAGRGRCLHSRRRDNTEVYFVKLPTEAYP